MQMFNQLIREIKKRNNNKKIFFRYKNRYDKYSFGEDGYAYPEQYEAVITRLYHTIEKGLSYTNYRPGFGKDNVNALLRHMEQYSKTGDITVDFYETALSVLNAYVEKNSQFGCEDPDLESKIKHLPGKPNDKGGILSFRPLTFEESSSCSYKVLMENRHSIRHFSDEDVDADILQKAIQLAQYTPSACNRQGWKTRIISSREIIKKVLDNQNGNSGFGNEINKLLVITSDLKYFNKRRETFQAFIDGGMYAMSVINSLSYYGIAHIPLSASLTPDQEENVRNIIGCDDSEVFILFIGTGCYPDICQTTRSERKIVFPEII